MICKLVYKKQIHLFSQLSTYKGLISFILASFSQLPKHFELTYKDEEGDEITLSSQDDLEVFALVHSEVRRFPKIQISEVVVGGLRFSHDSSFEVLREEKRKVQSDEDEEGCRSCQLDLAEVAKANQQQINRKAQKKLIEQEDEQILDIVRGYSYLRGKRITKLFDELEQEMLNEEVKNYTNFLNRRVARQVANEQEQEIKEMVSRYLTVVGEKSIERYMRIVKPENVRIQERHYRSKSSEPKDDGRIEKIVEKKVRQMIPSIIEKVSSVIEQRLRRKYIDRVNLMMLRDAYNINNAEEEEDLCRIKKHGGMKFPL